MKPTDFALPVLVIVVWLVLVGSWLVKTLRGPAIVRHPQLHNVRYYRQGLLWHWERDLSQGVESHGPFLTLAHARRYMAFYELALISSTADALAQKATP